MSPVSVNGRMVLSVLGDTAIYLLSSKAMASGLQSTVFQKKTEVLDQHLRGGATLDGSQPRCDGTKHGDTCVAQCSAGYAGGKKGN